MSVMLPLLCSCSLIDDDMTDCANNRTIDCRINEYGNVDSLLAGQLRNDGEQNLRATLSAYYEPMLHPASHSVRLSFYDAASGELCTTISRTIQGREGSLSVDLPVSALRCLGVSPSTNNDSIQYRDTTNAVQEPFYTGRLNMLRQQESNRIDLYPADAQVAVVASVDNSIRNIQIVSEGPASGFNVGDSTYSYSGNARFRFALQPTLTTDAQQIYTGSLMPSSGTAQSWQIIIQATTASGSITRTVLTINQQLKPAEIRVFRITVGSNGAATTSNIGVGATVTLDWNKGGDYNPTI